LDFGGKIDTCDPCVPLIIDNDSFCGKKWDKWCSAHYRACCPIANCPSVAPITQPPAEFPREVAPFTCPPNLQPVSAPAPEP
jgi:hypothetical protein